MVVKFNKWYINKNKNFPYDNAKVERVKLIAPLQGGDWAECEYVRYDGKSGTSAINTREFETHWKLENVVLENK